VAELPALSRVTEQLHLDGDDYVKEAATIGLLEGIQNDGGDRHVSTEELEAALGVEALRWWASLVGSGNSDRGIPEILTT